MIVRIVAGAPKAFINFSDGFIIAVDRGVKHCVDHGLKIDLAVGDFDSYDSKLVEAPKIVLKPEKDETDIYVAILEAIKKKPEKIYIYGGTNGRLDHYLANINLLGMYDIELIDDSNKAYVKSADFTVQTDDYVSFFYFDGNPIITLKGFKYPLNDYLLKPLDNLCVSNEVIKEGNVSVRNGRILVIESKKD